MTTAQADVLRPRCRAAILQALRDLDGEGYRREVLAGARRRLRFDLEEQTSARRARDRRIVDRELAAALGDLCRDHLVERPRLGYCQLSRYKPAPAPTPAATPAAVPAL